MRYNEDDISNIFKTSKERYGATKKDSLDEMAVSLGNIQDKIASMGLGGGAASPTGIPMTMAIAKTDEPEELPKGNDSEKVMALLAQLGDIANQLKLYMPNVKPNNTPMDAVQDFDGGCGHEA